MPDVEVETAGTLTVVGQPCRVGPGWRSSPPGLAFPHHRSRQASLRDLDLAARVSALDFAAVELEAWEEVVDPGGGDSPQFIACALEATALVRDLATTG